LAQLKYHLPCGIQSKDKLRIEHGASSGTTSFEDFGAEESFGQQAKRFEEHYGWAINRAAR